MKFLSGEIAAEDAPPIEVEELVNPLEFGNESQQQVII